MTNWLNVSQLRENLTNAAESSPVDRDKFGRWLGDILACISNDHRRNVGHHLVGGETHVADLSLATQALLVSRHSRTVGSKKFPVQVWPSPLEAWMNAEVVAAGIAGAIEHANGETFAPEDEHMLRLELTAVGLGIKGVKLDSLEKYS